MRLSYIIIPHETKLGSTEKLLRKYLDEFYVWFGGCTHYPVTGICKDPTKGLPCEKVEVAVASDTQEHDLFMSMAKEIAVQAGVKELMVQHPNGEILFIEGAN